MCWLPGGFNSLTGAEVMTMCKQQPLSFLRVMVSLLVCFFLAQALSVNAQIGSPASSTDIDTKVWSNPETGYCVILEDDADLLSQEEEAQLASQMQEITDYGNALFKTISYNNFSASYFAEDYYHGQFGNESGTLFLIDMGNRELYIFSDGAVYQTITKAYATTITDNIYRYASDQDYYLCASTAFGQIHTLLSGRRIAQPMKYISNALLALILAALINYFIVRLMSTSSKPDKREILNSVYAKFAFSDVQKKLTKQSKVYHPRSTGSSSGSHSGGGRSHSSGGGHSSGGRSGGGGGHRF